MSSEAVQILLAAIGLLLVVEGIGPFVAPEAWRRYLLTAATMSPKQLRIMGALFMAAGALLLLLR